MLSDAYLNHLPVRPSADLIATVNQEGSITMGTKPSDRSVYPDGTPTACVVIAVVDGDAHVHDAECRDLRKPIYREDRDYPVEVRDKRDCVDSVYGPGAGSFYAESGITDDEVGWRDYIGGFRFFPCVDLPEDIGGLRWTVDWDAANAITGDEPEGQWVDGPLVSAIRNGEPVDLGEAVVTVDGVPVAFTKHVDLDEVDPLSVDLQGKIRAVLAADPDWSADTLDTIASLVDGPVVSQSEHHGYVRIQRGEDWVTVHRTEIPDLIRDLVALLNEPV